MSVIHEIRLTREGQHRLRDLQRAHAIIRTLAGRSLWARPLQNLLIVQATHIAVPSWMAAEHRTVEMPTPAGAVKISLIAHAVARRGSRTRRLTLNESAQWLTRRMGDSVALDQITVEDMGIRRGIRNGRPLLLSWTAFHATGAVNNRATLSELMHTGVGRAKAYGCGLLLAVAA